MKRAKVVIELEIEGATDSEAFGVIDDMLDAGSIQDAINEMLFDRIEANAAISHARARFAGEGVE